MIILIGWLIVFLLYCFFKLVEALDERKRQRDIEQYKISSRIDSVASSVGDIISIHCDHNYEHNQNAAKEIVENYIKSVNPHRVDYEFAMALSPKTIMEDEWEHFQ